MPNEPAGAGTDLRSPRAFVSYSWDDEPHKAWVLGLAANLRKDGVETILDQWHAVPGDQLTEFMEREIRENDYVLIVCTPSYRLKSDERRGGVGYEGNIMTAEVLTKGNHRKFIPVLARGTWKEAAPSWLRGKYHVDLSSPEEHERNYPDLVSTILGTRSVAPPLGKESGARSAKPAPTSTPEEPLRIVGVIVDEVTEPRLDGTRGSGLYAVPFRLSREPSSLWSEIFVQTWADPPSLSTMHRRRIASVQGAKIILDGTTLDEVRDYHRDTLRDCVNEANRKESEILARAEREAEKRRRRSEEHRDRVKAVARDITFE